MGWVKVLGDKNKALTQQSDGKLLTADDTANQHLANIATTLTGSTNQQNMATINALPIKNITTKQPKTALRFKSILNTNNTTAYTVGEDGYLYIIKGVVQRIKDVSDGSLIETSPVTWDNAVYGFPKFIAVFSDGTLSVVCKDKICHLTAWDATPTIIKTFTNPDTFIEMGCSYHDDGLNKIVLAGEYGQTPEAKSLWLSRDGGLSFASIKQSTATDGVRNSHWHTAIYDKYSGRIWASHGDFEINRGVCYSDDFGNTWTELSGMWQPTAIVDLPNMIAFGPDLNDVKSGVIGVYRPKNETHFAVSNADFKQLFDFRGDDRISGDFYPEAPFVNEGDTAYIVYPPRVYDDNTYIFATGDGGHSWHCVYSGKEKLFSILGYTATGHVVAKKWVGGLVYADVIEWI